MTYFYQLSEESYGQISLHGIPPTHLSDLVTPMTLVLLFHAPILSPIRMDFYISQIQPLGGYFYPCHVRFVTGLQSGLNLS